MPNQRTIPNGLSQRELESVYRGELDRNSPALIDEISRMLATSPSPGESGASIEVFPDELGEGRVSIAMHFHGLALSEDLSASLGTSRHYAFGRGVRDMPRIDVKRYEQEVSIPDMTVNQIKAWFADCWRKAGGHKYPLRVEVFGHEDYGDGRAILLSDGA